ncbi:MAG TPA: hydrogenase expression/formation protein HypE [Anaerolineaceae bacterium]|nr:hydrogenase expression/formation protein HypE [Anaerolineaceae bacterium]
MTEIHTLPEMEGPVCPLPLPHNEQVVMGHGSGGLMTRDLINKVFAPFLSNPVLDAGNDFGLLPPSQISNPRLVVSTDSHIVTPLFFPGGDIGRLSVCGTVNDISMSGAAPAGLTAGFILEEGLAIQVLQKVVASMQVAAKEAGVFIAAGDTKVVNKGQGDGIYINTAGFGWLPGSRNIHGANAQPGDAVIISGSMGDHGIAVLSARGELGFSTSLESDVAPLNSLIAQVLAAVPEIHVLRDPTRGGLATTLNEIAGQSQVSIWLDESAIPVKSVVQNACEILGFDPLYVANEGKVIVILPAQYAEKALEIMQNHKYGREAAIIGKIEKDEPGTVLLRTSYGSTRILDMLAGEMLPRIC